MTITNSLLRGVGARAEAFNNYNKGDNDNTNNSNNNNNDRNHSKTVRSCTRACLSSCISQTLDAHPFRIRTYPLRGCIFLTCHV